MTVDYSKDARVDEYFKPLPGWQQEICERVRDLAHEADPEVEETIKRGVQPYFVIEGKNVCALQGTKDHVNVFLYDGGLAPDPEGIITDGHGNVSGRQIKVRSDDELNERALLDILRAIVADNRAGGWRKLKAERGE